MKCAYCGQEIVPAQHYLRMAFAIDTRDLEHLFEVPSLLAGFEFCSPRCLMYWGASNLTEFLLDSPEVRSTFARGY